MVPAEWNLPPRHSEDGDRDVTRFSCCGHSVLARCWPPHLQFGSISFNYPAPCTISLSRSSPTWLSRVRRHLHSRVESFQSMPLPSPAPVDEGWQVVSPEWWRIPLNAVSWAYSPTPQLVAATEVTQSPRVAKPPHYHASLFSIRAASADDQRHDEEGDDGGLNADLVGFKLAEAAIDSYEIDVGFHWPPQQIEEKSRPDLAAAVDEHHVALAKERWDELVQDLTGGLSILNTDRYHDSDSDDSLRGLHRSTSTLSSIDLTDSERSVLSVSMPATPRAHRSYPGTMVKTTSPSRSTSKEGIGSRPIPRGAGKCFFSVAQHGSLAVPVVQYEFCLPVARCSPFAGGEDRQGRARILQRSRVDDDCSSPHACSYAIGPSSSLPTRCFRPTAPDCVQDPCDGRSTQVVGLERCSRAREEPSAPPQLELSALSKPRLSVSEYGSDGESPTLDGDSEGWIGGEDAAAKAATANSKSRRTRDLFLALTRRRSNSSPPKPTLIVEPPADDLPSPTSSSSNDGWIEGPALLLPESVKTKPAVVQPPERKLTPALEVKPPVHRQPSPRAPKKTKRTGPPLPPGAAAFYARPPPPYYYPHAHPHAHAHPPMQVLQMQQQQQQMHMRRVSAPGRTPRGSISSTSVGSGEWYNPYPTAYPVTALHPAPVFVPRG
ncbi:hypothetical protein B0H14DRAFT_2906176 [Mycena olivaceomarginata]|nr:hypothetical protein B0H14DRAFT_2906176 [Mycena olivaceomarginata]